MTQIKHQRLTPRRRYYSVEDKERAERIGQLLMELPLDDFIRMIQDAEYRRQRARKRQARREKKTEAA